MKLLFCFNNCYTISQSKKVDITGILINYIENSFISYKISIKEVNWVQKVIATDIPGLYVLQRFFKRPINLTIVSTTQQSLNATCLIIY